MRISIGTTRPFHLFHLARELAALNHDVTLFSYMPESVVSKYNSGSARHVSLFMTHPIFGALALQNRWPSIQDKATLEMMSITDKAISERIPECDVYIGLSGMALDSLIAAKVRGILSICDRGSSHVLNQKRILQKANGKMQLSQKYVQRELDGYEAADKIVVPSVFSYNSFIAEKISQEKLFCNNYGVDLSRFSFGERRKNYINPKFLFVGNWSHQKGCDIFTEILEKFPKATLTHVGTKGDVDFPESARFNSMGPVKNSELSSVYNEHDIFIFPSRQDGFGMVLLEALACGLPIVASMYCGAIDAKQALNDSDSPIYICKTHTAQGFINSIIECIKNEENKNIKHERKIDASFFTWAAYAKRYEAYICQLLELNK